jgi:hypothetical protein
LSNDSKKQSQDAIHEALHDLHAALDGAENLEASDREDLVSAIDEIRTALGDDDPSKDQNTIGGRLRSAIERFEDRHPDLTKIMGRIANSLSDMGI